jgi:hypothetical protein
MKQTQNKLKKEIPHGVTCAEWGCRRCQEELGESMRYIKLQSRIMELESKIVNYDNSMLENPFQEEDKLELKILKQILKYR